MRIKQENLKLAEEILDVVVNVTTPDDTPMVYDHYLTKSQSEALDKLAPLIEKLNKI